MTGGEMEGRVVIVTGSQRGIGLETAKLLVEGGARVVLVDLPGTPLEDSAASVGDASRVAHRHVDISDEASVKDLIAFTLDTFGRLDALDNNATARLELAGDRDVVNMDVEFWDGVFAVNVRGGMLMCKHAIPAMVDSGGGSIVNISSGMTHAGHDAYTAYACTKGAIETLTRYVATQYGDQGIRCNAVAPGLIGTEKNRSTMPPLFQKAIVEQKLVGRLGEPLDIAQAVLFLLSERASFITGQVIHVDGGIYAHSPSMLGERKAVAELMGAQ